MPQHDWIKVVRRIGTPIERPRQRARLKLVYEGRRKQIEAARASGNTQTYGRAVTKYTRARTAWRAIRGWGP